jgi:hypothetical protein
VKCDREKLLPQIEHDLWASLELSSFFMSGLLQVALSCKFLSELAKPDVTKLILGHAA